MSDPKIYVVCPDEDAPSGGHKKLYRHVDILNRAGRPAMALHESKGFRYTWFHNSTIVTDAGSVTITDRDYLVVPEIYGSGIADICPGVKKVVLNQNSYLTFVGYSLDAPALTTAYQHADVVATIVVSEDNLSYLRHALPQHKVLRMRYSIDPDLFYYSTPKNRQICLMTRRNLRDAIQVVNILRCRDALAGFEVVALHDKTETETAAMLRDSQIFLSFSDREGFGLPPAEAMACGCITIGYHGRGGREFFLPEFSYPIEFGDIVGYARTVEQVICDVDINATPFDVKTIDASAYVRETYSPRVETADILRCWEDILS